jgi:hypothetical protein
MNAIHVISSTAFGAALLAAPRAGAEITVFVNDFAGWQAAAGPFTTVDFVENAPAAPVLFNHYESFGVLLHKSGYFDPALPWWGRITNETDFYGSMLHDAGGLASMPSSPHCFQFLAPVHSFGYLPLMNSPGDIFGLFHEGALVAVVNDYGQPIGAFRGVHSTVAFDEVRFAALTRVDDIYFSTIPAPGVISMLTLATALGRRRRR